MTTTSVGFPRCQSQIYNKFSFLIFTYFHVVRLNASPETCPSCKLGKDPTLIRNRTTSAMLCTDLKENIPKFLLPPSWHQKMDRWMVQKEARRKGPTFHLHSPAAYRLGPLVPWKNTPTQHLQPWNPQGIQETVSINSASGSGYLAKQRAAPRIGREKREMFLFLRKGIISPQSQKHPGIIQWNHDICPDIHEGNSKIHLVLMDFSFWVKS